ncbi:hypothetical protein B0H10DRAFT_2126057, partial [Mycena sp. CBHHK59/15]
FGAVYCYVPTCPFELHLLCLRSTTIANMANSAPSKAHDGKAPARGTAPLDAFVFAALEADTDAECVVPDAAVFKPETDTADALVVLVPEIVAEGRGRRGAERDTDARGRDRHGTGKWERKGTHTAGTTITSAWARIREHSIPAQVVQRRAWRAEIDICERKREIYTHQQAWPVPLASLPALLPTSPALTGQHGVRLHRGTRDVCLCGVRARDHERDAGSYGIGG